jgi:hypothetical protein
VIGSIEDEGGEEGGVEEGREDRDDRAEEIGSKDGQLPTMKFPQSLNQRNIM